MDEKNENELGFHLKFSQRICRIFPPIFAQRIREFIYPYKIAIERNSKISARAVTGSRFIGMSSDFHSYPMLLNGYDEWRNIAIALALCRKGDVIMEIGANVGAESVSYRDCVGENGKVYAFEPNPTNIEALSRVINENGWKNLALNPIALSDRNGKVYFNTPKNKKMSGKGHVDLVKKQDDLQIVIDCKRLDDQAFDRSVDLIVMDTEGCELSILRGGLEFIARDRPYVILEANDRLLRRFAGSRAQLFNTLKEIEYVPYVIKRFGTEKVEEAMLDSASENWICFPKEREASNVKVNKSIWRCGLFPFICGMNPMGSGQVNKLDR